MATRVEEIYIIEAAERTNLVTNPSVEEATTGYTAVGASSSIARTATYQRRGVYSLDITPTNNAASGVYFGTVSLVSGTAYTFSADVRDVAGQGFNLYIADTSGNIKGTATEWTGDGYWKRKSQTWTCDSTTTYRLYVTRDSVASTTHFYVDGFQCEAGSAASTYLDGDMVGFNRQRTDYGWNGTAHASTSWRSGKTRSGGTLLRVRDYASILGTIGQGMPPLVNNSLPSSAGGAFYQNTVSQPREVSIILAVTGSGASAIQANRAQLVDAIKPDNVPSDEPLVMRFVSVDTSSNVQCDPVDLYCTYNGGLEEDTSQAGSHSMRKYAVTFTAHDPMFKLDGSGGADLTVGTSVANAAYLLYRTTAGVWTSAGAVNGSISDIKLAPDGKIYVCGAFTSIGGVSANRIAYWDGAAWNALGTGLNGTGNKMVIAPDGYPYVVGGFTTANGVTVNRVAKWNGSTFTALGATAGTNGEVLDIAMDGSGNLYVTGNFTTAGGTTVNYVAKWTGSAWAAMASGLTPAASEYGWAIAINGTYVYVSFHGGTDDGNFKVYRWNGTAWGELGSIYAEADMYDCGSLVFGKDGKLYAVGNDTDVNSKVAVFSGGSWKTLLDGDNLTTGYTGYQGRDRMYFSSTPTKWNGISVPGGAVEYRNNSLRPLDVYIPDANLAIQAFMETSDGQLWVGGNWTTTPITQPTVTSNNNASSRGYPVVRLTGPGTFWQLKNYTTGKAIYFSGLTLQAGEIAILDLRPGQVRFESNWRGNMMKYIAPGSDLGGLYLISGANNISCYISGSSAATKALMSYVPQYWSIDGAAR